MTKIPHCPWWWCWLHFWALGSYCECKTCQDVKQLVSLHTWILNQFSKGRLFRVSWADLFLAIWIIVDPWTCTLVKRPKRKYFRPLGLYSLSQVFCCSGKNQPQTICKYMCGYGGRGFIYKTGDKISPLGCSLANPSNPTQASATRKGDAKGHNHNKAWYTSLCYFLFVSLPEREAPSEHNVKCDSLDWHLKAWVFLFVSFPFFFFFFFVISCLSTR